MRCAIMLLDGFLLDFRRYRCVEAAGRGVRAVDLGLHECQVVAGFDQVGYVGVPEALQSQFLG